MVNSQTQKKSVFKTFLNELVLIAKNKYYLHNKNFQMSCLHSLVPENLKFQRLII